MDKKEISSNKLFDGYVNNNWISEDFKKARAENILLTMLDFPFGCSFENVSINDLTCDPEIINRARLIVIIDGNRIKILKNKKGQLGIFLIGIQW